MEQDLDIPNAQWQNSFGKGKTVIIIGSVINDASSNAYNLLVKKQKKETFGNDIAYYKLSENLAIYKMATVDNLIQTINHANKLFNGIDTLIIDGHAMSNCLILDGQIQLTSSLYPTHSLYYENMFSDNKSASGENNTTLTAQAELLKQSASRVSQSGTSPILFFSGCNLAYSKEGQKFVEMFSKHVFNDFILVAPKDYLNVKFDNKDRNNLMWVSRDGKPFNGYSIFVNKNGSAIQYQDTDETAAPINLNITLPPQVSRSEKRLEGNPDLDNQKNAARNLAREISQADSIPRLIELLKELKNKPDDFKRKVDEESRFLKINLLSSCKNLTELKDVLKKIPADLSLPHQIKGSISIKEILSNLEDTSTAQVPLAFGLKQFAQVLMDNSNRKNLSSNSR